MTVLSLCRLWRPAHFADWYRFGAEYVETVADGMGFDTSEFVDYETGVQALEEGIDRSEGAETLRRSIVADLLADARFCEPFCEWMPLWYEAALISPVKYVDIRLTRTARSLVNDPADATALRDPSFSRPRDVRFNGTPAVSHVSGFADRFVFADAILHLEWFVHVARESGIEVPQALVDRTYEETVAHYADGQPFSQDVRQFQALLFADDRWVREINEGYGLNSALFDVWERILSAERRCLEAGLDR